MTVQCPVHAVGWRTAYERRGCRCETCTAENAAKSERQRRRRGDRVQKRKTTTAILCPLTGKPVATAYRSGCRCDTCVPAANREPIRKGASFTQGELDRIVQEAIEGLRADVGLVVELAEQARKSVENDHNRDEEDDEQL